MEFSRNPARPGAERGIDDYADPQGGVFDLCAGIRMAFDRRIKDYRGGVPGLVWGQPFIRG